MHGFARIPFNLPSHIECDSLYSPVQQKPADESSGYTPMKSYALPLELQRVLC